MSKIKIVKCESCGHETEYEACKQCDGTGQDPTQFGGQHLRGISSFSLSPCSVCDGTGIKGGRVIAMI